VRPKSELGEHPATKFVFNTSNLLFAQVYAVQADTDKQWQRLKYVTLVWTTWSRPFLTLRLACLDFDPTLGTTLLDQLTNHCVNYGDTYLLTLVQSRNDNLF